MLTDLDILRHGESWVNRVFLCIIVKAAKMQSSNSALPLSLLPLAGQE